MKHKMNLMLETASSWLLSVVPPLLPTQATTSISQRKGTWRRFLKLMQNSQRKNPREWNWGVSRHSTLLITIMTITWAAKVQVPRIQDSRLSLAKYSTLCSRMQAQHTRKSPTWSRRRMRTTPPLLIKTPTMSVSQAWIMNQLIYYTNIKYLKLEIIVTFYSFTLVYLETR